MREPIHIEYDENSHSRRRYSSLKARKGDRRDGVDRRKKNFAVKLEKRSGIQRRLNQDRRTNLRALGASIKVQSSLT